MNESEWSMQPLGPDEKVTFTLPGSHYRGFPVVRVCEVCRTKYKSGKNLTFTHKKVEYNASLERGVREIETYATVEEAEAAMDRGETVRLEFTAADINPGLIDLAHDLQRQERFNQWQQEVQ
jgi:hypothetical protein